MTPYLALLPEAALILAAFVALFSTLLPGRGRTAALLGALACAAAAGGVAAAPGDGGALFGGALVLDGRAAFARAAVAALTGAYLLWLAGRGIAGERRGEASALALLAAAGGMLLASASDLVTFFVALELATMPAYVMIGYRRDDARGLEGTLKYFLLSLLTSLVMLYGMSFLYGVTGSTRLGALSHASGTLALVGALLVAVGLLAKMSAAPFHFWAPDAYAGAPAETMAFVSTVPKLAGMAGAVRLLLPLVAAVPGLPLALAVAAAASIVLGNLAAFPQRDVRRLMAYSGIAHAGYLFLGLVAGSQAGAVAALFYAAVYAVPSMAIVLVSAEEGGRIDDLGRLAARRPWVAWAMVAFLLSLVGIPPLAGFFGKLQLFGAGLDAGWTWLVVLAVAASAVSAGYYFRFIAAMFLGDAPVDATRAPGSALAAAAVALMLAATLAAGILASPLLSLLGAAAR